MIRTARRQRTEEHLQSLENQFLMNLIAALRECASRTWGMFGQNDPVIKAQSQPLNQMLQSTAAESLIAEGNEIKRLRLELGFTEPFQAFMRFLEFRQMRGSNVPGEPKLAIQFLKELGAYEREDL